MVNTLQFCVRFLLVLGVIVGIAFMVMCTVFVIISIIHGDIKITTVSDNEDGKGFSKREKSACKDNERCL